VIFENITFNDLLIINSTNVIFNFYYENMNDLPYIFVVFFSCDHS